MGERNLTHYGAGLDPTVTTVNSFNLYYAYLNGYIGNDRKL